MRTNKTFEISYYHHVYFGEYYFEDGHLIIDNVHTFDSDEQRVEIDSFNDKEVFDKVYALVEDKFSDELEEYQMQLEEDLKWEKAEKSWEATNGK
jgi:hypothetical protein